MQAPKEIIHNKYLLYNILQQLTGLAPQQQLLVLGMTMVSCWQAAIQEIIYILQFIFLSGWWNQCFLNDDPNAQKRSLRRAFFKGYSNQNYFFEQQGICLQKTSKWQLHWKDQR